MSSRVRFFALALVQVLPLTAELCDGLQCEAMVVNVCSRVESAVSCTALWRSFLSLMDLHTAAPSSEMRWRHLAHRAQMLSKSMLRPECWVSLPDHSTLEVEVAGRPKCLSSLCLLDSSCHERHMVHELLTLAKQIDPMSASALFEATKDLFAWRDLHQTPMLFYPTLRRQVWYGEEDYPQLVQDLRNQFSAIKAEFLKSYSQRGGKLTLEEQEYSGREGWWCWDVWSAVDGWVQERCRLMPTLCKVLRAHVPYAKSSKLAAYLQEEVALFGLPPGEKFFALHNDGTNARVALLMPLTGGRWSSLVVRGEKRDFREDGAVLGFDASYDHMATYDPPPGGDERWVLSIALSHTDFDAHSSRGLLQSPPPSVELLADPHRWRQTPAAVEAQVNVWAKLVPQSADGLNVALLGSITNLAAPLLRAGAFVAAFCDRCELQGPQLHRQLVGGGGSSVLSEAALERLVLVPRTKLADAFERNSVDMIVIDQTSDLMHTDGHTTSLDGSFLARANRFLRTGGRVVGVDMAPPSLPAGSALYFESGLWWFPWPSGFAEVSSRHDDITVHWYVETRLGPFWSKFGTQS
ncbi:unnamed protein product [Symbiodinium sp. CCMP2592]|nr:unnamed protein product [Symbiodinium sp. CCMP2592]